MGIRGKLALLVPGVVALSLIGLSLAATGFVRREALEELRARHTQVLQAISVTAAVHVAEGDSGSLQRLIRELGHEGLGAEIEWVAVNDADGRLLAGAGINPEAKPTPAWVTRAVQSVRPIWEREGNHLRIAVPVDTGTRWATLSAQYSLDPLNRELAQRRDRWFLITMIAAAALGVALFLGLDRVVVRPLRKVQRAARRIGEGDLEARAPKVIGREVNELGQTLNQMAASLQSERANLERTVEERTRELRAANEKLEKLAVTDGLTGVFNHRRFQEALEREVQRAGRTGQPLSVLMIDVDLFKQFNDAHGHPAGDRLLRDLARTLGAILRQTDLLARYGGEEFAAILVDTDKEEALQVAERLRRAVERELARDPASAISISVGAASLGLDADSDEELLSAADDALYVAKREGRNRVIGATRPATVTSIPAPQGRRIG